MTTTTNTRSARRDYPILNAFLADAQMSGTEDALTLALDQAMDEIDRLRTQLGTEAETLNTLVDTDEHLKNFHIAGDPARNDIELYCTRMGCHWGTDIDNANLGNVVAIAADHAVSAHGSSPKVLAP